MTQRNAFIDAMRGVAALGVVAIHTAFHSGTAYTPSWFQSLTLLVDVPLFFVLAGWSGGYRVGQVGKTCKSLLTLWLKLAWFCPAVDAGMPAFRPAGAAIRPGMAGVAVF